MLGRRRNKENNAVRRNTPRLTLHPLFFLVGVWYAFTNELPLFLLSCLVAVQHECAHAFAAAKLGYTLDRIVLMPFGAVIDGDLNGLSFKDEIAVALWGPLCNLITAAFFVALWWCFPETYAYTDVACHASLSIALVNLLPAYPLDGGRVLRCALCRALGKTRSGAQAEKRAAGICRIVTFAFSALFIAAFFVLRAKGKTNVSLLVFGAFLLVGGIGNGKRTRYARLDISQGKAFLRGAHVKRVAIAAACPVKDVFKFLENGAYLVLEVYDERETHLFDLPQNELAALFVAAPSPYTPLGELKKQRKTA